MIVYIFFFIISFAASGIGAICGIGGGVIIKPLLDAFGVLSVQTISFLSGCTVLAMTGYSVLKSRFSGESLIDMRIGTPLAIGAALGGVVGKSMFQMVSNLFENKNMVGAVQAACLMVITFGTLLYTVNKEKIKTMQVKNRFVCIVIGLNLGVCSSFLGIGGGPINLVVLFFFFSMNTKTVAQNSLYIILFSQVFSLLNSLITASVPDFEWGLLLLMISGGILGGVFGRKLNKKISEPVVNKLFVCLMAGIICINIYNIYQFML